jgi:hypothetical protein
MLDMNNLPLQFAAAPVATARVSRWILREQRLSNPPLYASCDSLSSVLTFSRSPENILQTADAASVPEVTSPPDSPSSNPLHNRFRRPDHASDSLAASFDLP